MVRQMLGEPLPEIALATIDGQMRSLANDLAARRGAVVIFWSGVCSHCRRYDAYLNGFAKRYGELALLVVASRQGESVEHLRQAVAERRLVFPILVDGDRQVAHGWLVEQTPRAFLLDDSGELRYRGAIDNFKYPNDRDHEAYLDSAIVDYLAGRPIARTETPSFGCPIQSVYYQLAKPLGS